MRLLLGLVYGLCQVDKIELLLDFLRQSVNLVSDGETEHLSILFPDSRLWSSQTVECFNTRSWLSCQWCDLETKRLTPWASYDVRIAILSRVCQDLGQTCPPSRRASFRSSSFRTSCVKVSSWSVIARSSRTVNVLRKAFGSCSLKVNPLSR